MPAGTITLTNNSTAVTGSGTSFTSELKANDFIVAVVGGITYTLGVKSVDSASGVTLITAYGGPTTSGLAWTPVPNATLVGITAQVAADVAKAIRGLNMDKANWQQVFSTSGNITVNLPDGSQYSGPSWNNISTSLTGKMDKSQNLNDVANKTTAWNNIAVYGSVANTAAQGNDSRLNTVNGKTGGTISGSVAISNGSFSVTGGRTVLDAREVDPATGNVVNTMVLTAPDPNYHGYMRYYLVSGQYHCMQFVQNGTATFTARSNGACYAASFNPTSDARLKLNKEKITDALAKILTLSGYTFDLFDERKAGGLAQEIREVLPEVVTETYIDYELPDGTKVENGLAVDCGATFGLVVEAIKDLNAKVEQRDALIDEVLKRLTAIDGLEA